MVDSHVSKKNGRNIMRGKFGRSFLGKSNKLVSAERLITETFKESLEEFKLKEPLDCDIHAVYTFTFPEDVYITKKGVRSRKLPDLSNLLELPSDCLTKAGVITDDTIICSFDGSRRKKGEGWYLVVELYRYQGE